MAEIAHSNTISAAKVAHQNAAKGEGHKPATVLIVDPSPMFRKGLVQAILEEKTLKAIGETGSSDAAFAFILSNEVDVVLSDIDLPEMDGLQLADKLQEAKPSQNIAFLTMHSEEQIFNRAINLGANAYMLKNDEVRGIMKGILAAATGNTYISPSFSEHLERRCRKLKDLKGNLPSLEGLTPTEKRILKLVAQNKTSKEIASKLCVSPRTVGTHRNNISRKLQRGGKIPLINFALMHADAIGAIDWY